MQVLKGMDPQETASTYPHPYDHPYFGQLFLAAELGLVGWLPSYNQEHTIKNNKQQLT
jgi:hypothetical protein